MSAIRPPSGLRDSDFEEIEAAVLETERGRWFLAEYARRIRSEGTDSMLSALSRIEDVLSRRATAPTIGVEAQLAMRLEAIEERLLDLLWRLREEKAEAASEAVEAEVRALRRLTGRGDASDLDVSSLGADRNALERPGDLSRRLLSIEKAAAEPESLAASVVEISEEPAEDGCAAAPSEMSEPGERDPRLAAFAPLGALSRDERLAFFA